MARQIIVNMKYRIFLIVLLQGRFINCSPLTYKLNATSMPPTAALGHDDIKLYTEVPRAIATASSLTDATSNGVVNTVPTTVLQMNEAPKTTTTQVTKAANNDDTTAKTSGSSSDVSCTRSTTIQSTTPVAAAAAKSTTEFVIPNRIPTQLEEKLENLACDLPLLPRDSSVWQGNETHELLLPITIPEDCSDTGSSSEGLGPLPTECVPSTLSWEGAIEIQSGDVLLVRIEDSHLVHQETIINQTDNRDRNIERVHEPTTAVYQVTRTGHDNCDVTEGILLDITPLKIDNRKVVTLYDKDLTEGINLLIVVSELWGNQCVRLRVVVKSDNCGENEDCSGKGLCYSNVSMEGYECQCCPGFVGPHCEEQDACYPSPCKNNGICVDLSQGHEGSMFQCLCPYGYTGKTCEGETDPCTSMPCLNGANCTGNVTQFKCECPKGFSGLLCQHNLNECESSPCVHGICVDQEEGYKCFCQPGFTGSHCEYEYNECESSPCINGGTCTDHIGSYSCTCGRGFTGNRCHIKVDLCEPNPCPEPRYCLDRGNNYSCECPKGFSGLNCLTPSRAACATNPCTNGGTCWSSMDSFYCACRPGFTGKTCEDEFVVETITNIESINKENELDLEMPISIHLDHLHNVYIAAGTLISAFIIVAVIVAACHCRVNKIYKRFTLRSHTLWGSQGRRVPESANATNSEWFSGKDKAPTATPSRNLPSLDTTDMYYTLDFSESQSSPLIQ